MLQHSPYISFYKIFTKPIGHREHERGHSLAKQRFRNCLQGLREACLPEQCTVQAKSDSGVPLRGISKEWQGLELRRAGQQFVLSPASTMKPHPFPMQRAWGSSLRVACTRVPGIALWFVWRLLSQPVSAEWGAWSRK